MGTEITLDIGDCPVTYAKNNIGMDHGVLFQEKDRIPLQSERIDYEYFSEINESPETMEMAFSRTLKDMVPRLELLGFGMDRAESEYLAAAEQWKEERSHIFRDEEQGTLSLMGFDEFCEFIKTHPIGSFNNEFISSLDVDSDSEIRKRFDDTTLKRIPFFAEYDIQAYSERSFFIDLCNFIHPYFTLRLLSENSSNLQLPVTWQYGPLAEAGWANHEDFVPCARRTDTILLVTEGTSDVHILQHALNLIRPDVEDFFRFIDVSESHPFSGTGNLVRFAEGLAKIDIQNMVLFIFDNDAEGIDAHRKICNMTLPNNVRGIVLPDLKEFESFPTLGPEGMQTANINGRAASIECYLDLETGRHPTAQVRWTNYKKGMDIYQGSLEYKDTFTKEFLEKVETEISSGNYNISKLEKLVDLLISESASIAASQAS